MSRLYSLKRTFQTGTPRENALDFTHRPRTTRASIRTRYHQLHMPAQITGDLHTILTAAAFAPLNTTGSPASLLAGVFDRAFLRITGPDAPRWLNGMVTNNIQALNPGEGNYNFLLNAQGRIQGDCTVYREPFAKDPTYILETDKAQIETIQQLLDKFIIMDDVELTPGLLIENTPGTSLSGVTLLGPQVADLLDRLMNARKDFATLGPLPAGSFVPASFDGHEVFIMTPPSSPVHFCEVWCADRKIIKELLRILDFHKVPEASPETLEALRIVEARPRYGTDIRNTEAAKDLPQETNQPHALHFAKGCYLGQEIVERIRSRGQVHRLFTPFRLQGSLPTSFPTPLEDNGKPAVEITSATAVPTTDGPVHLALGYARREALAAKAPLSYPGGTARPRIAGTLG